MVEGGVGVADCEAAAVEEDEDWFEGLRLRREGRPDVEGEAVFILGGAGGGSEEVDYSLGLGSQAWVVGWLGGGQGAVVAKGGGVTGEVRGEEPLGWCES